MANRPGFHKSDKRKKELARLKKQEEKKQRRLNKNATPEAEVQGDNPEQLPPALVEKEGQEA